LSAITSIDPCEGNIKQSEGGKEVCTCTSIVKSKPSSPIKASHLLVDDVIEMLASDEDKIEPPAKKLNEMLTSDEDEAEPPAKKLRCTIDAQ